MTVHVKRLASEPIVIVTFEQPVNFRAEVPVMLREILEQRDTITEPVSSYFVIIDLTEYIITFSDLIFGLGELRGIRALRRDDMPARLMIVGMGGIIEMGVKALSQSQYGSYQSRLFDSVDAAIAAARHAVSMSES